VISPVFADSATVDSSWPDLSHVFTSRRCVLPVGAASLMMSTWPTLPHAPPIQHRRDHAENGRTIIAAVADRTGVTVALPLSDALAVHSTTVRATTVAGSGPDSGFPYD
jgi:hypothetical protein